MEKKTKKTESTNEVKKAKAVKKELTAKERGKVSSGNKRTPFSELLFCSCKCPYCGSYDFGWVDPTDGMVMDLYCSHCHKNSANFPFY